MKVFRVNDVDWVAASTLEEAIAFYKDATGLGDEDLDDPRELTDDEMDRFKHYGEDGERSKWAEERIPTFRQELVDMIASGDRFPCLFASTEI